MRILRPTKVHALQRPARAVTRGIDCVGNPRETLDGSSEQDLNRDHALVLLCVRDKLVQDFLAVTYHKV